MPLDDYFKPILQPEFEKERSIFEANMYIFFLFLRFWLSHVDVVITQRAFLDVYFALVKKRYLAEDRILCFALIAAGEVEVCVFDSRWKTGRLLFGVVVFGDHSIGFCRLVNG
jgi:hypothetical protein